MSLSTDRITFLPEGLISMILDRMPLKDAVCTSILSLNWKNQWKTRSNIEINDFDFPTKSLCIKFTHQWLQNYHLGNIETFYFKLTRLPYTISRKLIQSFIQFAITHKTKTLYLEFPRLSHFELPSCVYEYKGFRKLILLACKIDFPKFVNLNILKTLCVGRMALRNRTVKQFILTCPSLEKLSLYQCSGEDEYEVYSTKLKSLDVQFCYNLTKLSVTCPNLTFFKYAGEVLDFQIKNLDFLDKASLDFSDDPCFDEDAGDMVLGIVLTVSHARVLNLCGHTLQLIALSTMSSWEIPAEMKAEILTLGSSLHHVEYFGVASVLISCLQIEKIQFNLFGREIFFGSSDALVGDDEHPLEGMDMEEYWKVCVPTPSCMINTVREVVMNGFRGRKNEYYFLKHLIEFGLVLQTVRVVLSKIGDNEPLIPFEVVLRTLRSWVPVSAYELNIVIE